jgi:hypothetical protein
VVRYLHIYDRSKKLAVVREDVQVAWSDDNKIRESSMWLQTEKVGCGLKIVILRASVIVNG